MKNSAPKNRRLGRRKTPNILDEWNCYLEMFSLSEALEISRQYLLLVRVILQKNVIGCPVNILCKCYPTQRLPLPFFLSAIYH